MKTKMFDALVIVGTVGLVAVQAGSPPQHNKMHLFQVAQGVPADGSEIHGSSAKLTRGNDHVWIRVNTTRLPPGAYTNWWVVFNNPSACIGGCGADDFGMPAGSGPAQASVFFATGGIVGQNGVGHFDAHLEEGVLPGGPFQVLFGPGLLDAQQAEIHYILRYHGPVMADIAEKQITTANGGCSGAIVDPVMADRRFPCYDPQATGFLAP